MTTVVAFSAADSPGVLGAIDKPVFRAMMLAGMPGMVETLAVSVPALLYERATALTRRSAQGNSICTTS